MESNRKIRVGAVNYLNTKPLIHRLAQLAPQAELILDLPSRLADDLLAGRLDIALIPSIELFADPAYTIVSDACIGCHGPVMSVKLFSRVDPAEIRTLALDEGSRTSVALIRILLWRRYGIRPELRPLPIGASPESVSTDAVLLIGDRAMHAPGRGFAAVWDLGDEWRRLTDLPFVFAMWVARADADLQGLQTALEESRDQGLRCLEEIAELEAAPLGLSQGECVAYLRDNLHFRLGPQEQRGLELFYEQAGELELAPAGVDLGFYDCKPAG